MAANLTDLLNALPGKSPAALRDLFAALGFTPRERVFYSGQTLRWPENLGAELRGRRFELLADLDGGVFQVLLLAPQDGAAGLALALQRRLFQTLEERLSEGLLVMPSASWDLFELVLLTDTRSAEQRAAGQPLQFPRFSFDPRALRPHQQRAIELLAVHGVAGVEAAQHLRRAFGRAQQETLFRSQGFFSSYYLEQRIEEDVAEISGVWRDLLPQGAAIRAAAEGFQARPLLAALGWEMLAAQQGGGLFALRAGGDEVALLALLPEGVALEQAVAEGDYPQLTLIAALEQAKKQKQGAAWGILTNGRVWRLYSTLTSSISGVYYEVDLGDLLQFGDERDLRFFTGFFGATGLATGFVRRVFYASQTLAKQVGEDLKRTIFEEAFEELATGIAHDLWRQGRYTGDEAQRSLIFRATLVLLYRILFLLYAESRRLLPTLHPPYYAHSLTRLLTDIAIRPWVEPHNQKPLGPTAYWAWDWLRELFRAVAEGRREWGVPRYNGGLFSDGRGPDGRESEHKAAHRLLAEVRIGALYLTKALTLLGRDQEARAADTVEGARRLIDYAALDVRRLGSIYEGLLEYQLEQDGTAEDGSPKLRLPRTHGARKSSGSYYTPDYIVAYIVEQAVGPVLDERERRFDELMSRVHEARKALEREERKIDRPHYDVDTYREHQRRLAELEHEASETLLDLKVLDPAMGSGHFLVETVDFLTDRLIAILRRHPQNPVQKRIEAIRADIRASLREQGVDALVSEEQLSDTRLLRRLVMKRCVYGVDLNDMAVELARLSLWLHSFTVGAPLSFLDHHLKWGNSLIGARAREVQAALEQVKAGTTNEGEAFQYDIFGQDSAFAEMLNLASTIEELVQIADANGQQVEHSAELYAAYEERVVPVKRLLDLWVSQHFGSKEATQLIRLYSGSRAEVSELVDALMGRRKLDRDGQRAVETARALFERHRFLHWDLDFPEVFIDLQRRAWKPAEEAGFDAVVGNPPYLNAWSMTNETTDLRSVIESLSPNAQLLEGHWDLYVAFIIQAINSLRVGGYHSFIVPDAFAREKYARSARKYILEKLSLPEIMHFEGLNVFDDVSRHCIIYVLSNKANPTDQETKVVTPISDLIVSVEELGSVPQSEWINSDSCQIRFNLANRKIQKIIKKLSSNCLKLGQFCYVMVGATTHSKDKKSFTKDTIVSAEPKGNAKRFFDGRNVSRYHINWDGRYIDYRRDEMYGPRVPELFESDKVVVRDITGENERLIVSLDHDGMYCDHLVTCVTYYENVAGTGVQTAFEGFQRSNPPYPDLAYITALLASQVMTWYFRQLFATSTLQGSYSHTYPQQVRAFPIRRIAFTTPAGERERLVAEARALYERQGAPREAPTDWRGWREHWRALWEWADARLPRQPDGAPDVSHEQSDAVHDLLAFLAERMIALHKAKQETARGFTSWLEQQTGSALDEWKLKTVVQSFWEQPWDELARALHQNRARFVQTQGLRGKAADAALEPLVRAARSRWEQSTDALAPTLALIGATDRLIDLLVYRLYGLTDDEIDLVEES